MSGPRFSVVIPTRERADTLRFALQTCLVQNYKDYEIVVCDNCSSSATKEVVELIRIPAHRIPSLAHAVEHGGQLESRLSSYPRPIHYLYRR